MNDEIKNKVRTNVLLQGSILAVASLLVRLIGLIYRIPLTRIIGDDGLGYYTTAFEFYDFALLLSSYSLPLAVSKLISVRQSTGRHKDARRALTVGLLFGLSIGALASGIVYFGADLYARFNHAPLIAIPLRVLAPTIFVFSVMGVIRGYFQGYGNMMPTALSQVAEQIVNAAVSIGAAVYLMKHYAGKPEQSAYGAAGGTWGTFSGACAAAVILFTLFFVTGKQRKEHILSDQSRTEERYRSILKILLLTAIPVMISQTVYQLSGLIDVSIFHRTLTNKGVAEELRNTWWGIYSGKYKLLTNVPVAIASAMGTAIVPGLVAEIARGHRDAVKHKTATAIKLNMIIAFPCAFGFISIGGPILRMLYNDTRELSEQMMSIGGFAVVLFAFSTVTNGVLQGINHMFIPVRNSLLALVVHCTTLYLLLKFTDLDAVALVLCNLLFALLVCLLNSLSIRRCLDYRQEWHTTFVIPLCAAALMGLFARIVFQSVYRIGISVTGHVTLSNMAGCLLAIIGSAFLYFSFLIMFKGVSKAELLEMPKGKTIVGVLTRLRLLKE